MNRKEFILKSSLTAFAMSVFGVITKGNNGEFLGDCETTNDILVPYYRANAPLRSDLTYKGQKGTKIELKGKVFIADEDCATVIKDALVEIWHCDTNGEYDNISKEFKQRACWKTNEKGEYAFQTILPGKYLNGELYRPSHIHFRVTAEGHKELISQIYFQGDPHIAADPWASQEKAQNRILPITPEDTSGNLAINFDIFLQKK